MVLMDAARGGRGKRRKPALFRTIEAPGLPARKTAARLLAAIVDAHTSLDALTDPEHGHPQFLALDGRDRALVRAILVTALRHRVTISRMIERHLDRPLPPNARSLAHILHAGAAQILFLAIPDSAAVDLAVQNAKSDPRTVRFAGLVNALLRNVIRARDTLPEVLRDTVDAPQWFAERLAAAYGADRAAAILATHRVETPTDLTVKSDAEGWAEKLGGRVLPTGSVRLAGLPGPVPDLPGFGDGAWWIQDAAAALPARLLGDIRGLDVADLCAAPGGKTAQLALAGASVTALDISASRLRRLEENLSRLGLPAKTVAADIRLYRPDEPFDAVLLDAPCSSTGTVRRHPDIPWTKSPEDIARLAGLQRELLERAVDLVRPGGRIVFSNCSLDPLEGEELIRAFVNDRKDVRLDPIGRAELPAVAPFVAPEGWLRTTPADLAMETPEFSGLDGFFAACFRKAG
jgi:16S rRNA (cytosine967-C5)-methyltransferase